MTAAELIEAITPCLPLPGITVAFLSSDALQHICVGDDEGFETLILADATRLVKGAIADACAERRWSVMQGLATMHIDIYDNNVPVVLAPRKSYHAHGTDAIAWCKAYAQACEKGGAA